MNDFGLCPVCHRTDWPFSDKTRKNEILKELNEGEGGKEGWDARLAAKLAAARQEFGALEEIWDDARVLDFEAERARIERERARS